MDTFNRRAFELVTSPRIRDALDLSNEDPQVVARYGPDNPELVPEFNAAPRMAGDFLTARRLVEAGARCVTVSFGAWDWHYTNFPGHRSQLPYLDRGLSALVDDLHARGLDRDVLVVVWGEFGRSPRVNKAAGRDHWPGVACGLGGRRTKRGAGHRLDQSLGGIPAHAAGTHARCAGDDLRPPANRRRPPNNPRLGRPPAIFVGSGRGDSGTAGLMCSQIANGPFPMPSDSKKNNRSAWYWSPWETGACAFLAATFLAAHLSGVYAHFNW